MNRNMMRGSACALAAAIALPALTLAQSGSAVPQTEQFDVATLGPSQRALRTELWVVEAGAHKVLKRLAMPEPMNGIAISRDETPRLYAVTRGGHIYTLNRDSGQQKLKGAVRAGSTAWVPVF